eukprot:1152493-Pelagomonas_calceolata.AAC.7
MRRSKRLRNQASSGGDSSVGQQQEEQQREEPEPATKRRKKQGRPPYNKGRPQRGKEPQPSNEEGEFLAPDEEPLRQGRAQANGRQSMQAQGKQKCKKDVGPTRQREEALWAKGYAAIGGLDEADWTVCDMHRPEQTSMDDVWQQKAGFVCFGILTQSTVGLMACEKEVYKKCRGPLAGPVVAGICVLPKNPPESLLKGLNDSKLLNEAQRNDLYARITTSEGVLWAASSINYQAGCKMQNHTFWCKVHDLKTIYTLCEGAYRCMIHGNDCFLAIFTAIDRFKPSMKPWYCVARCPGESFSRGVNLACQRNTGEKNLGLCLNTTALDTVPYFRQVIDSTTIDRINILQAALRAMREAAMQLPKGSFDYLLVDGNKVPEGLPAPAEAVVKGDATSSCIAAASVIAKGYGVPEHTAALRTHGPCAIHRRSFQPIRSMTSELWPSSFHTLLLQEYELATAAAAATAALCWTRAKQLAEEAAAAAEEKAAANPAAAPGDTAPAAASAAILQLEAA